MTNKEKYLSLVSLEDSDTVKRNKERIKNRNWLRLSQKIALKVLMKLDNLGWSQKDFAKKMKASSQAVTKIVSGKENITLKTIAKIEKALNIVIFNFNNIKPNANKL